LEDCTSESLHNYFSRSTASVITIAHELDYHMSQKEIYLPPFERIVKDPPGADVGL